MKRFLAFAALTLLASAASTQLHAQNNPILGTWKLNLEKSKYSSGPAPKSMTRTVEAGEGKVKYTFAGVSADGNSMAYNFTVSYDGKNYPITGSGAPGGADSIAIRSV